MNGSDCTAPANSTPVLRMLSTAGTARLARLWCTGPGSGGRVHAATPSPANATDQPTSSSPPSTYVPDATCSR